MNKLRLTGIATLAAGLTLTALPASSAPSKTAASIYQTAIAAGNFSTLVTALQVTGLDAPLDSNDAGRFTVFAPTDAAFAALPGDVLSGLLADPDALAAVLTYHVVSGGLFAPQVLASPTLDTLNGQRIDISLQGSDAYVDQAKIEVVDIPCSNGVIHVIDAVLLPNDKDIVATAASLPDFTSLLTAAGQLPGIVNKLTSPGRFTVFAPNDAAFAKVPSKRLGELLNGSGKSKKVLRSILEAHIVPRTLYADQLVGVSQVTTLGGVQLPVSVVGSEVFVGGVRILATDVETTNGVIHVIEDVIIP